MKAYQELTQILKENKKGIPKGIYSICSAHNEVIGASMKQALEDNSIILIESTSNQVDQFGGYTGMTPCMFVHHVQEIAGQVGFPVEKIIFGGDHLGPNVWQALPSKEAMAHAKTLVREYVKAGYLKIHLDASMRCFDDVGDTNTPLTDEVVAQRSAELCIAAEESWKEYRKGFDKPVYIIGTEVPIPGGAQEEEDEVKPTSPLHAEETIRKTKEIFFKNNLKDAWDRVIGLVVQPGVEFGDDQIFHYNRNVAGDLSQLIRSHSRLVFEAHSTDYQSETELRKMVEDHFCILKVGPWLTFAYREAVFALESIEQVLLKGTQMQLSGLKDTLEEVMLENPKYWQKYYSGSPQEQFIKRRYSFSDRSRYYWTNPKLGEAVKVLEKNLDVVGIPLNILSQFMPDQYVSVQEGRIGLTARELIIDKIQSVVALYSRACRISKNSSFTK